MKKYLIDRKYFEDDILDFEGKLVMLREDTYKEEYRKPKYLLVLATGGFGCYAEKIGRAVYYRCIYDGEHARTDRGQVFGVIKDEYKDEVIEKYCK